MGNLQIPCYLRGRSFHWYKHGYLYHEPVPEPWDVWSKRVGLQPYSLGMKPVRKGDLVLAPDSLRLKTYPLEVSEVINCMLFLYLYFISNFQMQYLFNIHCLTSLESWDDVYGLQHLLCCHLHQRDTMCLNYHTLTYRSHCFSIS
jgi:hypothetical protein